MASLSLFISFLLLCPIDSYIARNMELVTPAAKVKFLGPEQAM